MKKLSIIILAAMAMVSCGNTYTAQQVELANMNDSMNFALGIANGSQMKAYYLRNDSSAETVAEFIDALQASIKERRKVWQKILPGQLTKNCSSKDW